MSELTNSYQLCRRITRRASSTFYLASLLFDAPTRRDIQVLYAFCRVADDIADATQGSEAQKLKHLGEMEQAITDRSTTPEPQAIWPAVWAVVDRHALPIEQLQALLHGVKSDIRFIQPTTLKDLDEYSYLVAGVVGELSACILGVRSIQTFRAARQLGIAMQYTNIIRDVEADLDLGRIYIPKQVMRECGVTDTMLKRRKMNGQIYAAIEKLVQRAEQFYREANTGIDDLEARYQQPVRAAAELYRAILERTKQKRYNVFAGRNRLNRREKLGLVWNVYFPGQRTSPSRRLITKE